ncbi:MAPEG family protein [Devosia sp.]|uniref:MAPEG family protein n=1 Tax=Devosia sp. TaxID=1871048 RepID=UPI002AFED794|nr:MAPEG family protein [Devosia sp.]
MLLIIFFVLALTLVQALLPAAYLSRQLGSAAQMGPRDDLPPPSRELGRAQRALANLHETLPIFLTLAILSLLLEETGALSLAGGWIYLGARLAYVPCYLKGLTPWRSVCFTISMLGLLGLAAPLLVHMLA